MRLLVTGGAGFIGANFIYETLSIAGGGIVCLDALTYAGNLDSLKGVFKNPCFTFVKGDITDAEIVFHTVKHGGFDAIVNFAAETHVDRSITCPDIFLKTNILGTQVLMDACLKYRVPRFHQISTDEVYGDLPLNRPDLKFTEESPLKPSSPYAASKAAADLLVLSYCRTYGLNATISRSSNNYGAYQYPEKLIPLIISRALRNESLPVYGDGLNVRDWLYVCDHCRAVYTILLKGIPGEIYNIGADMEKSNIEVVRTILNILNKPESLITYVEDRPGHDRRYTLNAKKIAALGWKPSVSFKNGIEYTVNWYKEKVEDR